MSRSPLTSWIEDNGMQRAALAGQLGVSRSAISCYENGRRAPRLPVARKIESITRGAIPASSWGDPPPSGSKGSEVILDWMARHGLTIVEAAEILGISYRTVRNLIHLRRIPTRATLSMLRTYGPAEFETLRAGDFE